MRFYHQEAIDLVNKLLTEGGPPAEPADDGQGEDGLDANVVEQLRTILTLRKMAGEEAARAAPSVHPRVGYDSGQGQRRSRFCPARRAPGGVPAPRRAAGGGRQRG